MPNSNDISSAATEQQTTTHSFSPDSSLLTSLLQSLPLNIYAKDREGRFIFANTFYCNNVGKPHTEIIGKTDFEIHPKSLALKYRTDDERIMQSKEIESIEEEWQSLGGERGYIEVLKSPLYDSENRGNILGTIGIFWDITDRKTAERNLAEERNLLRTVIDNVPGYIYVKDRESKFILANKAVVEIMGATSPDDLIHKTDHDFYVKTEADKFYKDEQRVIGRELSIIDTEEQLHNSLGEKSWVMTSKLPLRNIEGEVTGLIGMGHDITKRKQDELEKERLETQLRHSQKMETVGTLTAGIAHDFNNLLNVINGYTEFLTLDLDKTDPQYIVLSKILQAGNSAADLISQLMTFSRKQVTQPIVLQINQILSKTYRMIRPIIGEKISIDINLQPDLWRVIIDPIQLEQIIVNLATNARDAMPGGGLLTLKTDNVTFNNPIPGYPQNIEPGKYVRLSFSDTGTGIPKDLIDRIFEPFFTTKNKYEGTGLGLATVYGIVKQHGGTIQVESKLGEGTTVQVYIPKTLGESEPVQKLTTTDKTDNYPVGTETILVAEDEQHVRDLVVDILRNQGYTVYEAASGDQAIEIVNNMEEDDLPISLLITDVIMPGMDCKELVRVFSEKQPDINILLMSGYTGDTIDHFDLTKPGITFIQKPFRHGQLTHKVRDLLDE